MAYPIHRISLILAGAACTALPALSLSAGCGSDNTGGTGGTGGTSSSTTASSTSTSSSHSSTSTSASSTSTSTSSTSTSTSSTSTSTSSTSTSSSSSSGGDGGVTGLNKVNHFVVIYLENHSFDNLYGEFPNAEGMANGKTFATAHPQVDATGTAYTTLPQDPETAPMTSILPNNLPNAPFLLDTYVPLNWTMAGPDAGPMPTTTPDVTHRYYHEISQIHGGKMDQFVLFNGSFGMAMGYYHTANLKLYPEAMKYVLCDHFYHAAFGGSFLNHQWLIAAATPKWEDTVHAPPASLLSTFNDAGAFVNDGQLTTDLHVVNTSYSVNKPIPSFVTDTSTLIPNFTNPTIGDKLIAANVDWAWYAGGWDDALAGSPDKQYQFHHQPFQYYKNFADGTTAKTKYLLDEKKFIAAAAAGTLPAVSFVKPIGEQNEHPSYADVQTGEQHTLDLINAVRNGPNWKDSVIIITYDEHGGYWDHVVPPTVDQWGPGLRVPTIIISPFAKSGVVDSTAYDTTAILTLIEKRYALTALSDRDKNQPDISAHALDFTK